MSTLRKNRSNETPVIRGNKSSNSRRGISKLTARTVETTKSQARHSPAVLSRKHKKNTADYLDEDENIVDEVHEAHDDLWNEDNEYYSLIFDFVVSDIMSQMGSREISADMIERLEEARAEECRRQEEARFNAMLADAIRLGDQWLRSENSDDE